MLSPKIEPRVAIRLNYPPFSKGAGAYDIMGGGRIDLIIFLRQKYFGLRMIRLQQVYDENLFKPKIFLE